ncbi:MAG: hypothetical protein WA639_23230 [Candidatus Acidiferrum sp.]
MPRRILTALVEQGGQIIPGDIYYANDDNPGTTYLAATDGALVPIGSLILSGNITGTPGSVGPAGPQGETGETGPQGPATPLSQQIALTIALG